MSLPLVAGSCFGYEIHSSLSFSLLREGSGEPIEISTSEESWRPTARPLLEWLPRHDRPLHAQIYADGDAYRLWTDREGWFRIDPTRPSITAPPSRDLIRLEERVLAIPLLLCFLRRGDLPLHAAAVEIEGNAVLLAAPGHFGKTTLATAFLRAGHRVLSEDIACCRVSSEPCVLPGPAMLRVRTGVGKPVELPLTRPVAHDPERIHLSLEGTARGDGRPVPLAAVVFLRPGKGVGDLERVDPERALPDLWSLSLKLPSDSDRARCFDRSMHLADRVPLWNLHRALRFDTLPRLVDMIADTCRAPV